MCKGLHAPLERIVIQFVSRVFARIQMKAQQNSGKNFTLQNEAAARVILEDPEKYDGALLIWARLVLAKLTPVELESA